MLDLEATGVHPRSAQVWLVAVPTLFYLFIYLFRRRLWTRFPVCVTCISIVIYASPSMSAQTVGVKHLISRIQVAASIQNIHHPSLSSLSFRTRLLICTPEASSEDLSPLFSLSSELSLPVFPDSSVSGRRVNRDPFKLVRDIVGEGGCDGAGENASMPANCKLPSDTTLFSR